MHYLPLSDCIVTMSYLNLIMKIDNKLNSFAINDAKSYVDIYYYI